MVFNHRFQFALRDVIKRSSALLEEIDGRKLDLGDRERWIESLKASLDIVRADLQKK